MWRGSLIVFAVAGAAFVYLAGVGLPGEITSRLPAPVRAAVSAVEAVDLGSLAGRVRQLGSVGDGARLGGETVSEGPHPANANLETNPAGLAIIKRFEGLRLVAYPSTGQSYIGYGHQLRPGEPEEIDEEDAERLLRADLAATEAGVRQVLRRRATANEFSAMVSLAYTIGVARFADQSPVLVAFNAGETSIAADAFRTHNTVSGIVAPYLVERRELERQLFLR